MNMCLDMNTKADLARAYLPNPFMALYTQYSLHNTSNDIYAVNSRDFNLTQPEHLIIGQQWLIILSCL